MIRPRKCLKMLQNHMIKHSSGRIRHRMLQNNVWNGASEEEEQKSRIRVLAAKSQRTADRKCATGFKKKTFTRTMRPTNTQNNE